jgi:glutathione peroxidase
MNRLTASLVIEVAMILIGSGCGRAIEGVRQEGSALRFTMKSLDGKDIDLARYEGKVVMVVNVASKCGYTPQYAQLQTLYEQYADKGFVILGFPCNQFLGQEPGSAEEIKEFCRLNYGVTFDMFAKVDVKGENACELYKLLTSLDTEPKGAGKIGWNFEKFILDRQGFAVARFASGTKPNAAEIVAVVEKELAKARRSGETDPAGGDSGGDPEGTCQHESMICPVNLSCEPSSDCTVVVARSAISARRLLSPWLRLRP